MLNSQLVDLIVHILIETTNLKVNLSFHDGFFNLNRIIKAKYNLLFI